MRLLARTALSAFTIILLTIGFAPYLAQDAFAVADITYTAQTATTTTITLTWSENVDVHSNASGDWTISTGQAVTSITHTNGTTTSTLNLGTALAADATPTVTYAENGNIDDTATVKDTPVVGGVAGTDGIAPTVSSVATTSDITIVLTMSETMVENANNPTDFVISGPASNPTVGSFVTAGTTITLTLTGGGEIVSGDTITVAYTGTAANDLEDASNNDLADFAGQAVTNNVDYITPLKLSGGSCGIDCTEPTLGVNSDGTRLVDNGFSYNGQSIDVDYYFTPYPLVTVNVGKQNVAEFKIYENRGPQNIQHFELAFGLANGDSIGMSKAVINWDKSFAGIETITLDDPGNVLDNVRVITSEGSCSDETETKCLIVIVEHTFRAPLDFNILATNVWDTKRNAWQNYYNHGIEVVGESMNPPEIYDGINKGQIYHLTETGKGITVDEFGNAWTLDKIWKMDYIPKAKIVDGITLHGIDRNNTLFNTYKQDQALLAQELLEERYLFYSDEKFDEINDIFAYEYSKSIDKSSDVELQNKMIFESERAQKIMDDLLDPLSYRK